MATTDGVKVPKEEFYAWRKPGTFPKHLLSHDQEEIRRCNRTYRAVNQAHRRKKIVKIQEALMATPMKTVGFGDFVEGLRLHNSHTATLQEYYGCRTRLDARFRRFIRQQKGVERLLTAVNISPECNKVVAMGRAYTGRRAKFGDCLPVSPVKMVARQLAKRCRVVMTNEHRSSKTHASCGHELSYAGATGTTRLTTCAGCGAVDVERDLNAARNIAEALWQYSVDHTSPAHLDRDPARRPS